MPKCLFCHENVPLTANQCPKCGAPIDGLPPKAVEDLEQQVRSLLGQGQKLNAVKLYKESTGVSLKEAKDAVEAIERGESPKSPAKTDGDMEAELLRLLGEGQKFQAVMVYRERTGTDLSEAMRAVEALAARHGMVSQEPGCFSVLVALLVAAVVVGMTIR